MTPPPTMQCSSDGCDYETPGSIPTYELVIKTLELHVTAAHSSNNRASKIMTEKPKRPSIVPNMSESDWVFYEHKWTRYRRQSGISGQQVIDEIWACLDPEMERLAFQDGIESKDPDDLLRLIKSLAVTTIHPSLHVVTLHSMTQNHDETIKAFSARVRGVATNCELRKECSKQQCKELVSFLEETCYHVVMTGIASEELKEKVLTQAMIGTVKDLPSLVEYVTAEESSKHKNSSKIIASVSKPIQKRPGKKCSGCGQQDHGDYATRKKECQAFGKKCKKCGRMHHYTSLCRSAVTAALQSTQNDDVQEDAPEVAGFITGIMTTQISSPDAAKPVLQSIRSSQKSTVNVLPVPHYVYCEQIRKWKKQAPKPSPTIEVSLALDKQAYADLNLVKPDLVKRPSSGFARDRRATLDSGAQLTVVNEDELQVMGIKKNSIFPLALTINTVTHSSIDLIGGVFMKITTYDKNLNVTRCTRQLCYV